MNWGGARKGAGRPHEISKFGCKTIPMRVPEHMVDEILEFIASESYSLPLYSSNVAAGFPAVADEHVVKQLDLNKYLINSPPATFLVRDSGDSMIGAGIHSGDILVVDRSVSAANNKIVIASIDGFLTVKRLVKNGANVTLKAENDKYPNIELEDNNELVIWGVVTSVIHKL